MYQIAMTKALSPRAMDYLRKFAEPIVLDEMENEKILEKLPGADALIFRGNKPADAAFFRRFAALGCKVFAKHGTGLNGIDLDAATEVGIPIVFAPGANARSVAEYTVSAMLSVIKHIPDCSRRSHDGDSSYRWTYQARQFQDMRVYVIGFGNIGRQVAAMCRGLGMHVTAYDMFVPAETMVAAGVERAEQIQDGLADADVVTIHTPLTPQTEHLVDAAFLDRMKPGAYFINTARGELMDEVEVCRRLEDGRLAGAAFDACSLDEATTPLPQTLNAKNLTLSCHIAAQTVEACDAMGFACVDGIIAVLERRRWQKTANPAVYDCLGWQGGVL